MQTQQPSFAHFLFTIFLFTFAIPTYLVVTTVKATICFLISIDWTGIAIATYETVIIEPKEAASYLCHNLHFYIQQLFVKAEVLDIKYLE